MIIETERLILRPLIQGDVDAMLDPRNVASEKVAIALGMRKEAHHIRDDFFKGEWMDTLIYAVLKSEWVKK
jgi:RimJ/RimL family protein N-acetyltransferase